MEKLCAEMRAKWPSLHNVAVYHRTGVVGVTEASVVIAVSSAHRRDSLEALHFAIDELKAKVPIWKKEVYEGGQVWKQNKECMWMEEK
jgi:molybdopterin synthase catalytic subunit